MSENYQAAQNLVQQATKEAVQRFPKFQLLGTNVVVLDNHPAVLLRGKIGERTTRFVFESNRLTKIGNTQRKRITGLAKKQRRKQRRKK
mgnify:CR=1 FL=1